MYNIYVFDYSNDKIYHYKSDTGTFVENELLDKGINPNDCYYLVSLNELEIEEI